MPSFSVMKNTIYDVIKSASGKESMWDYQDAPMIDKPFFSLSLSSFGKVGRDVLVGPDINGLYQMNGNRHFTLTIMGIGPDMVEATYILQSAFERPDIHEEFRVGGIFPFDIDQPILDISSFDLSQAEERSTYPVYMRTDNIITGIPAGIIEKINMVGTFKQPGKADIVQTLNIDSTI